MQGSLGIDWISGTIPAYKVEDLICYMETFSDSVAEMKDYGQYRYDRKAEFVGIGATVFYDSTPTRSKRAHNGRALFVMIGSGLGQLTGEELFVFVRELVDKFWMKATRLDCCFDDFEKRITPETVYREHVRERQFTRFRKSGFRQELDSSGDVAGEMVTFGTRGKNGGGSYLRYYRKDLESEGVIDAYRWEVEFSKEKAQEGFFMLSRCPDLESFVTLVGALVGGSIDFVKRKGRNLPRSERLTWWQGILDVLGEVGIRIEREPKEVEKAQEWVKKSVVGSLATIERALGEERFWGWLCVMLDEKRGFLNQEQMISVGHYWAKYGEPDNEIPF